MSYERPKPYSLELGDPGWELSALRESIRNIQFELSVLRHKLQEHEQEANQIGLRWGRRLVVLSNLLLGLRCFFRASSAALPPSSRVVRRSSASQLRFWRGVAESWPFFLCASVHVMTQAWRRDLSFLASAGYSLYVGFLSQKPFARTGNACNILVNIFYFTARYYYLHGLLTFSNMQVL